MATAEPQVPKLSDIFDRAWKIQLDLEGSDEASNSDKYQLKVKEAIGLFEQCTEMVNQLSLFSDNEDVEEIPTSSLKYLLLPAFLGDLSLKVTGGAVTRLKQVHKAKIYFQDFLKRCKSYGITAEELPKDTPKADPAMPAGRPNLMAMQSNREAKIKRFKEKKQLEEKLKALGHPSEINSKDEDVQREFFTVFIKKSASEVVDDYASVQQEIEILGHMEKLKDQDKTKDQKDGPPRLIQNNPSRKPLKPFILTRDDIQAKVFGAGYPSIPTMTLDEYYEKEVREGKILPPSNQPALSEREAVEQREIQREKEIEDDDETALKKAREMDDWKDDNKRGSGNRQNMG
ncbi:immunoglobulin-binding protein 1-like isoform X2 [Ptychodera flava]|uniref:immunoglobulin-binding protein 1-like isoform X1 n=1 Tax=Ptychodera flava TaxID=63121 RepID=UPI003969EEC9